MNRSLLIRDVVCFTPAGRREADCLVSDGEITEIGSVGDAEADVEIDGAGRWLWPGAIDGHVHFREPGPTHKEDWATGSAAAVAGGVTTVFDMPNTNPSTTSLEQLEQKRAVAEAKSRCNFGLYFGATPENAETLRELSSRPASGGVPGLKIFMGSSTGELLVCEEEDLERVFGAFDGLICIHGECEHRLRERAERFADRDDPAVHSEIRDPKAAAMAVEQACRLALKHERDLHVLHLSTREELVALQEARRRADERGLDVRLTAEACPHHLLLDTDAYADLGTRARVNPPLRAPEQKTALWEALAEGRVQTVATDHAPHTIEEKERSYREAPSGLPGVQTMVPLLLDAARRRRCQPEDVVKWVCEAPAELYGLVGRGRLEEGAVADLMLLDPAMERVVTSGEQLSRSAWTPWEGRRLRGWPVMTIVGGEIAYRRDDDGPGDLLARPGLGTEVEFGDIKAR